MGFSVVMTAGVDLFLCYDIPMNTSLSRHFSHTDAGLRNVNSSDASILVDIINDAYSYQDKAKGEPRTNVEHLIKRVNETDFYVVEKASEIAGCVYLEPYGSVLHFGLLTIVPKLRGTGLAPAIIEAIIEYASRNNYSSLELDYMSLAPWLKDYYERYGFKETGEKTTWGSIELVKMRRYT